MTEMRNLTAYFGCFDGTGKPWSEVEPFYNQAFSTDVSIVTTTTKGKSKYGFDDWKDFLQYSLTRKADIHMISLNLLPDKHAIEYSANLIYPDKDEPIPFASTGYFNEEGKLIKIVPLEKK